MSWAGILAYLTALNDPPPLFGYPLGQHVLWTAHDGTRRRYVIRQRRLTESAVSEWIEYLLACVDAPVRTPEWAYEPDVKAAP